MSPEWQVAIIVTVGIVIPAVWAAWMAYKAINRDTPYLQRIREDREAAKELTQRQRAALLRERQLAERAARDGQANQWR